MHTHMGDVPGSLSGGDLPESSSLPEGGLPEEGLPGSSSKASQWRSMELQRKSTTVKIWTRIINYLRLQGLPVRLCIVGLMSQGQARTTQVSHWNSSHWVSGPSTLVINYLRLQGSLKGQAWRTITSRVSHWINGLATATVNHLWLHRIIYGQWSRYRTAAWAASTVHHWINDSAALDICRRRLDLRHSVPRHSLDPRRTVRVVARWSLQVNYRLLSRTAAPGHGQEPSSVTGLQDCDRHQAPSSHSTGTSNVCRWTTEQPQHSSIKASAGAQHWITDNASTDASTAATDARIREGDTSGDAQRRIGSTESRLATLRWSLDFNEIDGLAPLNVDLLGQRSSPLAVSANGESSAGHHFYASPGGRKYVGGGSQVDYDCGSVEGDSVTCSEHRRHSFSIEIYANTKPW